MININEYIRFRELENRFKGVIPAKRAYAGATIVCQVDNPEPADKFDYLFHPLFGTIVIYSADNIGKTPLCEAIDKEILEEVKTTRRRRFYL